MLMDWKLKFILIFGCCLIMKAGFYLQMEKYLLKLIWLLNKIAAAMIFHKIRKWTKSWTKKAPEWEVIVVAVVF